MLKTNHSHTIYCGIKYVVYLCILRFRTCCQMGIQVVTGPEYIELQHSCTHHHVQIVDKGRLTIEKTLAVQRGSQNGAWRFRSFAGIC